jgi:hypothetical protein
MAASMSQQNHCEQMCADLLSFGIFLQDVSVNTSLLKPPSYQHQAKPEVNQRLPPLQQPSDSSRSMTPPRVRITHSIDIHSFNQSIKTGSDIQTLEKPVVDR